MKTLDLTPDQRITLKGYLDAALPTCAYRKRFYTIADQDFMAAIDWLSHQEGTNHNALTIAVDKLLEWVK